MHTQVEIPLPVPAPRYERAETRALVALVNDAAGLVREKGETAFDELRRESSRWRTDATYVFVLDSEGNMLVHPDPKLEGANQIDLKDVAGKPIIRGLIDAAATLPSKPEGWYHYQWPVPGSLHPRWKSSYVRAVRAFPSGKRYIIGSGAYDDRMERAFVVDMVANAVGEVETRCEAAFDRFRDRTGPFIAKDAYVFVIDMSGIELVNPAFPSLEGRNVLDVTDSEGKPMVEEMIRIVKSRGSGWVSYLWPRPGESKPTRKTVYASKAMLGDRPVVVCCGVY